MQLQLIAGAGAFCTLNKITALEMCTLYTRTDFFKTVVQELQTLGPPPSLSGLFLLGMPPFILLCNSKKQTTTKKPKKPPTNLQTNPKKVYSFGALFNYLSISE